MLAVCALTSVAVFGAWAQEASIVGVKEGDNFTYSFYVLWSSTNPSQGVPQEFSDWNNTISIHINVTDVGPTMAYLDITKTMRDGTHASSPDFISVSSGRGVDAQLLVIAANLTAGDKAYPESTATEVEADVAAESFTIGETTTRTYLGTSKTVNHYSARVTNSTNGNYVDRDAYYDKETGILLEMTIGHYYADLDETDSEHWKITQFNSAVAPSDGTDGTDSLSWFIPVVIVVVIIIVTVLLVVVMLRRRGKNQAETPPPESPEAPQNTV